jgi:hypothetical protein
MLAASTSDASLPVILLTGGGLAIVGTVVGAIVTQVFTTKMARESRREARRVALKSFQRETLVALQDNVVALNLASAEVVESAAKYSRGELSTEEYEPLKAAYRERRFRLRMLASRVRDEQIRGGVDALLRSQDRSLEAIENPDKASPEPGENPFRRSAQQIRDCVQGCRRSSTVRANWCGAWTS